MPTLDSNQNCMKKSTLNQNNNMDNFIYRICYFNFPVIPESEFLCYTNEYIYNWINNYQIRFDLCLRNMSFIKNSLELLFRLYRFPIVTKYIKN